MKFALESFQSNIKELIRALSNGLSKLAFSDNFQSFAWSGEISAGAEVTIRNSLNLIPSGYIIYKQQGNGLITAGDVSWASTIVTLKNHGAANVKVTVLFFK